MFDGFISSLKDEFGDFDTSTSEFHLREIYKRREFGREVLKVVKRGAFKSLYELFFNAYRLLKFVDEGEEERFMDMLAMLSSAGYTYSNGDYEALGCIFRDFIKGKGTIVEKIYGRKNDIKAIKGYRFDLSDAGLFYSLNDFSIFDDVESKREFVKNEIGKGEKFDRAFGKVYESNNCIEKMSAAKVIKIYLLINTLYDRGTLSLIKEKSLENLSSRLEFGGLVFPSGDKLEFEFIGSSGGENTYDKYVLPGERKIDVYKSVSLFHFHATFRGAKDYAGPSSTDLEVARRYKADGVVFTLIDETPRLNVDFYTPSYLVQDVGTY